jgi:hypothetical protein
MLSPSSHVLGAVGGGGAAVTWNPTAGVNKYSAIVLTNGNLTSTPTTDSGYESVEATSPAGPSAYQFEVTLASIYGSSESWCVGISNGTTDFSALNQKPGVLVQHHAGNWFTAINDDFNNLGASPAQAPGDIITIAIDETAGTAKFFHNGAQIGSTLTGLSVANFYAYVAGNGGLGALTANFTGPFTYPQSGYSAYS